MRRIAGLVFVAASSLAAGCGPAVDLDTTLHVASVATGWVPARNVNGQNKIVPAISFTLMNGSDQSLNALQVNAVFRRQGETVEWSAAFRAVSGSKGLAPGTSTNKIVLMSDLGYTGEDLEQDMLRNARFVDANVDLYAKYGSAQWVRLNRYPVDRTLFP
jgi:hypothetical protein